MAAKVRLRAMPMSRALTLAARGRGWVEPNPMVGAVIMRDQSLLGAGYHQRFGGPHAEANALADCRARGHDPAGAVMYVTLEPCSHHGKTPPCADALICAGIAHVAVAMQDPNPPVAGRGIARLRDAGVRVHLGLEEAAARRLNEAYLKRVTTGLPWVIAKWAQTLDGKIASSTGDSKWISNDASRRHVHALRGRVDAIVTGVGTVLADDPSLTARDVEVCRTATRIVVGPRDALPPQRKLLTDGGPEVRFVDDVAALEALLRDKARSDGWTNVLVEAGGGLLGRLFRAGLVDQVLAFVAPKLLGDDSAKTPARGNLRDTIAAADALDLIDTQRFGDDVLLDYRVSHHEAENQKHL